MYGMFVPLLFPIALFGIFNIYFVERISLAYYYPKPQMLNEKLNTQALKLLRYAPVWMFFFGYWAVGNRQMFYNEVGPRINKYDNIDPEHKLMEFKTFGCDITCFGVFLVLFLQFIWDKVTKARGTVYDDPQDENLPSYW
jgi:hypothetical protein